MKDIDIPYASIVTGILFILSEILPFIPKTGNGFIHSVVELIKNRSKENENSESDELESINTSERIQELKKKLEEINNEINEEMKKEFSESNFSETDEKLIDNV